MDKYDDEAIYKGDIIKYINGKKTIIEKDAYLAYNSVDDKFFPLQSQAFACLYSICLEREKLTDKEAEEYEKIFNDANYPYTSDYIEGRTYIDNETIIKVTKNKKSKAKK